MNEYGPNSPLVKAYLAEILHGFRFDKLGSLHSSDVAVRRIYDWDSLRKWVDYSFADAGPHNCPYLRFLSTVDGAYEESARIARDHGLGDCMDRAMKDASRVFLEADDAVSGEFLVFTFLPEYDEPYPFCRFSIQDHCAYIAAELVVAHLTRVHLLRDMWFWYRAGHWPCGWEGDWPEGRLIVF